MSDIKANISAPSLVITPKPVPFKMIVETPMEQYRYDTFWTKEPETIAWIDDMQPGEVLYDVGSNIGIYTLYAASRGVQVVAIEPVLENFHRLVQNVELNGFDKVIPIYTAVGSYFDTRIDNERYDFRDIIIPDDETGSSGAYLGESASKKTRKINFIELDGLIKKIISPHYIKIDTDGSEMDIVSGAHKTFMENFYLKSALIEVNYDKWPIYHAQGRMYYLGFIPDDKYNFMTPHSRERRQREGITAENVVFTRIT
jgi:FkbM family methyltransferase